jgi:hypothetical protein
MRARLSKVAFGIDHGELAAPAKVTISTCDLVSMSIENLPRMLKGASRFRQSPMSTLGEALCYLGNAVCYPFNRWKT